MGAAPLCSAEDFASWPQAVADCTLVVGTTSSDIASCSILCAAWTAPAHPARRRRPAVALLFGSEKFGLSNDDLSHCHWLMRIPTVDPGLSMNLGQAVALCLYELARDPGRRGPARQDSRRHRRGNEQITARLFEVLERSGYVNPPTAGSTEDKVRRLVRRLRDCRARRAGVAGHAAADSLETGRVGCDWRTRAAHRPGRLQPLSSGVNRGSSAAGYSSYSLNSQVLNRC